MINLYKENFILRAKIRRFEKDLSDMQKKYIESQVDCIRIKKINNYTKRLVDEALVISTRQNIENSFSIREEENLSEKEIKLSNRLELISSVNKELLNIIKELLEENKELEKLIIDKITKSEQ